MTPIAARRKAAGMVKIKRDYLGWAVRWPSDVRDAASKPRYQFCFSYPEARKVRAAVIEEIKRGFLQEPR